MDCMYDINNWTKKMKMLFIICIFVLLLSSCGEAFNFLDDGLMEVSSHELGIKLNVPNGSKEEKAVQEYKITFPDENNGYVNQTVFVVTDKSEEFNFDEISIDQFKSVFVRQRFESLEAKSDNFIEFEIDGRNVKMASFVGKINYLNCAIDVYIIENNNKIIWIAGISASTNEDVKDVKVSDEIYDSIKSIRFF